MKNKNNPLSKSQAVSDAIKRLPEVDFDGVTFEGLKAEYSRVYNIAHEQAENIALVISERDSLQSQLSQREVQLNGFIEAESGAKAYAAQLKQELNEANAALELKSPEFEGSSAFVRLFRETKDERDQLRSDLATANEKFQDWFGAGLSIASKLAFVAPVKSAGIVQVVQEVIDDNIKLRSDIATKTKQLDEAKGKSANLEVQLASNALAYKNKTKRLEGLELENRMKSDLIQRLQDQLVGKP